MAAPKEATGKPRASLLPMDVLIRDVLPAYEEGCVKYKRESWRKGFPVSEMFDAAQRHMTAFFYEGEDIDPNSVTEKHHLAGAVFSLLSILHTLKEFPELDDRRKNELLVICNGAGTGDVKICGMCPRAKPHLPKSVPSFYGGPECIINGKASKCVPVKSEEGIKVLKRMGRQ